MSNVTFIGEIQNNFEIDPEENMFISIWSQYERVIIESLITSFGLDFIVTDQRGGDVDTIFNVRNLKDENNDSVYKNKQNKANYRDLEDYDKAKYHNQNENYHNKVKEAKKNFNEKGEWILDGYVQGNKVAYNKSLPSGRRAELDHIIATERIHNDPGRVLAGLSGEELANSDDNLIFTNMKLNNNMKNKTIEEYIKWCEENPDKVNYCGKKGEPLPEEVKQKLRKEYMRAKKSYESKLARAYYTSPRFAKDTAIAAGKRGVQMGIRQGLGFIFAEIWFSSKDELQKVKPGSELKEMLEAVGRGIKKGIENAKAKYKEIIDKVEEGIVAGALSSFTTTLCNIFFTTAKNLVKCIRQIYASVIQAGKVLLFNPDNLMFGERIKKAASIIATGASVLIGTAVGELIGKTAIGCIPVIGDIVQVFSSTLVSGLLSCTLLVFLDRSKLMNAVVKGLNMLPSEVNNYKEMADMMEYLATKLSNIDIDLFRKETEKFGFAAEQIAKCEDDNELHNVLIATYKILDIKIPWEGNFDSFMENKSNRLVFE